MKKLTNHQPGPRGVNLKGGATLWIEPDETAEVDMAEVVGDLPDLGKKPDAADDNGADARATALEAENLRLTARVAELEAQIDSLDRDGDGKVGGSKPAELPGLAGKNKAELLDIAKAEGVTIEDGATNADIVSAIELHRESNT